MNNIIPTEKIPFQTIDWNTVPKTEHPGETGTAYWQTMQFDDLRVRIVEYTKGYLADHWCRKGHIVHCLEGEFVSELENGETFQLTKGMRDHLQNLRDFKFKHTILINETRKKLCPLHP